MTDLNQILDEVKGIIKEVCDRGDLYNSSEVKKLLDKTSASDITHLKSEAESVFQQGTLIGDRFYATYLRSLLWTLLEYDKQFVIDIASKVLEREDVLNKEPWVIMLEELDELEPIATFFKNNTDYGDRFFQEKLLYILSETNIEIGNKILSFLNSKYEILSSAALTVLDDQNLKQYFLDLMVYFEKSRDSDLIVKSATILVRWDSVNSQSLIQKKINELNKMNKKYYSDSVQELKILISQI